MKRLTLPLVVLAALGLSVPAMAAPPPPPPHVVAHVRPWPHYAPYRAGYYVPGGVVAVRPCPPPPPPPVIAYPPVYRPYYRGGVSYFGHGVGIHVGF
jgi:hypothetical protein